MSDAPHVAVIGAGMGGLAAARRLADAGVHVTVFEKSRGAGGRCATRRSELGSFHHGVASFAAQAAAFRAQLLDWQQRGWVQCLADTQPGSRWVGMPTMNALARHLAAGLAVCAEHTVLPPQRDADGRWQLATAEHGPWPTRFDALLMAVPAEQARPLCAASATLQRALAGVHSQPCWTLMLGWPAHAAPPMLPTAAALARGGLLAEVADMSGLPSAEAAGPGTRWVLHAGAAWSAAHLELPAAEATQQLLQALAAALGGPGMATLPAPVHAVAHRWRYAQVSAPAQGACGWDAALQLGSCGDAWAGAEDQPAGPPAEGMERAWLSGQALAAAVLATLPGRHPTTA